MDKMQKARKPKLMLLPQKLELLLNLLTTNWILVSGSDTLYFYQIEKATQYSTKKASIEYSDLLEVIKALSLLKEASVTDLAMNPDYLENKFVTEDGAQIGYYVSDGSIKWFIKLEKYGSDTNIFINDFALIEAAFNGAKTKIEELK